MLFTCFGLDPLVLTSIHFAARAMKISVYSPHIILKTVQCAAPVLIRIISGSYKHFLLQNKIMP